MLVYSANLSCREVYKYIYNNFGSGAKSGTESVLYPALLKQIHQDPDGSES
jgi:hypothetical protein